jgi:hypothetical protein
LFSGTGKWLSSRTRNICFSSIVFIMSVCLCLCILETELIWGINKLLISYRIIDSFRRKIVFYFGSSYLHLSLSPSLSFTIVQWFVCRLFETTRQQQQPQCLKKKKIDRSLVITCKYVFSDIHINVKYKWVWNNYII